MRFLVDGMLGGLARWLRILGQETRYDASTEDNDLLRIAHEENMILLTRDEELYQRAIARKVASALVLGETEEERLAQIASTFKVHLDIDMANTKCPECGSDLEKASKNELAGKVPQASLRLYNQFWKCANHDCEKVYWVGGHWNRIRQTLEDAKKRTRLQQQ